MFTRRTALKGIGASALALPFSQNAFAQTISKPANMLVGFAAGGGTDASARLIAERLRGSYAPAMVVENKVGAASRIAVEYLKNAAPDGSTMLFSPDFPFTLYPSIFKKLNYDPLQDFIAVAPMTTSPLVVSVGPSVPAEVTNIKTLLDWARANPAKASYATTGAGGTPHLTGAMLAKESKVAMTPVHYRGGGPAIQDLVGGHVAISVNPSSEVMPLAKEGKLRMLAVAGSKRSPLLPNIPTLREGGLDIALDTSSGIFLPAKTPPDIVAALSAALEKISKAPDFIEAQAKLGNELVFQSQPEFAAAVKTSIERWRPAVAASGFVPEE